MLTRLVGKEHRASPFNDDDGPISKAHCADDVLVDVEEDNPRTSYVIRGPRVEVLECLICAIIIAKLHKHTTFLQVNWWYLGSLRHAALDHRWRGTHLYRAHPRHEQGLAALLFNLC